jgi:ferredoxin
MASAVEHDNRNITYPGAFHAPCKKPNIGTEAAARPGCGPLRRRVSYGGGTTPAASSLAEGLSMRATVDQCRCIGCELCAKQFPALFEIDETTSMARAIDVELQPRQERECYEAIRLCPCSAIGIQESPELVET